MSNIFKLNQEASKSKFVAALRELQVQGAGVLATLETARLESLVEFDRRLQSINARRTRSWRAPSLEKAVKFVVSDFTDIDQANTMGTIRADSSSISLRERAVPAEAVIKTNSFSSNRGTVEAIDAARSVLRVHTDDFSTPTGQFDIELVTPLVLSQVILDIVATPSSPTITASISGDGLTYTPAISVALNGYRVNLWFPSVETRFLRIQITPSHPDDLSGNTFTFGITSFSAQSTDYYLRSEILTKPIVFAPQREYVVFSALADPLIEYYLSITAVGSAQGPYIEVQPGDLVTIGNAFQESIVVTPSSSGVIAILPSDVYINTIQVKEGGTSLRFAPGLLRSDPLRANLINEYVSINPGSIGYDLLLVRSDDTYSRTRTFDVSYIYGPSAIAAQLKVQLSTNDRATSPMFRGASLDEV